MNLTEMLLDKLMEECAEVIQRAAKANRFGLDEVQPGQDKTNRDRLLEELRDVLAVVDFLEGIDVFHEQVFNGYDMGRNERINKYLQHSRDQGTLQDDEAAETFYRVGETMNAKGD